MDRILSAAVLMWFIHFSSRAANGVTRKCPIWPVENFRNILRHEEMCYFESKSKTSWDEARQKCSSHGGTLLMIKTKLLNSLITTKTSRWQVCKWMGITDKVRQGRWIWIDGSEMTYTEFKSDFISEILQYWRDCMGLCAEMFNFASFSWLQLFCIDDHFYICQTETIAVNEDQTRELKQAISFGRLSELSGYKLLAEPTLESTADITTQCIRQCTATLSPCAIISFHKPTGLCYGYSSHEVIQQDKKFFGGWENWQPIYV